MSRKPLEAPDEFMIDETNVDFLEAHMEEKCTELVCVLSAWLGYYTKEDYGRQRKLLRIRSIERKCMGIPWS